MNAYLVDAGEHIFERASYYEPEEVERLIDIVIARNRGAARYLLWKNYRWQCYLDNIHETNMTTRLIAYDIAGPERCLGYNYKDPAYILWRIRLK